MACADSSSISLRDVYNTQINELKEMKGENNYVEIGGWERQPHPHPQESEEQFDIKWSTVRYYFAISPKRKEVSCFFLVRRRIIYE
jgi:hypothetical protein